MRFRKALIGIQGTRPLWLHAFNVGILAPGRQEKTGTAGNDPEEWRKTVLVTENLQLYLPGEYLFGCLRDGSRHTKKGTGSIMSKVSSTLQILSDKVVIENRCLPDKPENLKTINFTTNSSAPVYLDIRGVKNPTTKGRNVRYRVASSPGWEATFEVFWDATIVQESQMEAVLHDAGALVGVGDGRSIGMGRFKMTKWEVTKMDGADFA